MEIKKEIKYEAIFALVNQGFTDPVMEAARKHGVKGGTIINARGGSSEEAEKNYGVVITPDKELLMILVEQDIKNDVVKAIYDVAGIETEGMGLIWTMPADDVIMTKGSDVKKEEKAAKKEDKAAKKEAKKAEKSSKKSAKK